jgi:non-heme chloroperoxidase
MNISNPVSQFFYAPDGTRIFFTTNFLLPELKNHETLIVFNYGLVCNSQHWKDQISYFDQNGYKILLHDYRSHFGSSGKTSLEDCNFNQMVQDLHLLLESIHAKKFFMLGHSMGVNVTLEFSRQFPEKLVGGVLISGTVLPPQDVMFDNNITDIIFPFLQYFSKEYPKVFKSLWSTSYMNPLARSLVYRGGFNTKMVPEEFIELYMKKISELPQDMLLHLMLEMKNHDIIADLESLQTPFLIMGGDLDKVIPNHLQIILHEKLPHSELYFIKDGSHVPQVDFPETVNERIQLFLDQIVN